MRVADFANRVQLYVDPNVAFSCIPNKLWIVLYIQFSWQVNMFMAVLNAIVGASADATPMVNSLKCITKYMSWLVNKTESIIVICSALSYQITDAQTPTILASLKNTHR